MDSSEAFGGVTSIGGSRHFDVANIGIHTGMWSGYSNGVVGILVGGSEVDVAVRMFSVAIEASISKDPLIRFWQHLVMRKVIGFLASLAWVQDANILEGCNPLLVKAVSLQSLSLNLCSSPHLCPSPLPTSPLFLAS